ncbi:hypothetical protein [Marinitenerispora sediminis]|uniref:Alkaline shock response membrane anchor protein AmaP n=1 Tax=Marinitenerispora sediminis TaxID=1931232 RepID=A0A368SZU2_9ACTN|nr:hypothetical protein [Marinitenerispora sediminis]RCV51487.1 hypothetical protein DEF24_23110 [Marinitenerispora sediminis]RCV52281.1 hypothetical protein DEF28_13215 [Marinitenerispora sediminis]RCV58821.1 hypothetical protein DEF23_08090 [Marinitenerispora sediminis]
MTTVEDTLSRAEPPAVESANRRFRSRPSWASVLGGAVLVLVAGLAAAEVIAALAGLSPRAAGGDPAGLAGENQWHDPVVRLSSWVVALIGLAPIVLALGSGLRRRWSAARHRRPAPAE